MNGLHWSAAVAPLSGLILTAFLWPRFHALVVERIHRMEPDATSAPELDLVDYALAIGEVFPMVLVIQFLTILGSGLPWEVKVFGLVVAVAVDLWLFLTAIAADDYHRFVNEARLWWWSKPTIVNMAVMLLIGVASLFW